MWPLCNPRFYRLIANIRAIGRVVTVLSFVVISYLALSPSNAPTIGTYNDKLDHICAFFALSFGLTWCWQWLFRSTAGALLLYGISIELVQMFVPGRTASIEDVVADIVGISLGLLFGRLPILKV